MKRLFNILGNKVVTSDGQKIGNIFDIAIPKNSLLDIEAFIIKNENDPKQKSKIVHWHKIKKIEDIAKAELNLANEPLELTRDFLSNHYLFKKDLQNLSVFTSTGKEIGLLKDLYICEKEGIIECIQCSDGLIKDIARGRTLIPLVGNVKFSKDMLVIHKDCLQDSFNSREVKV